MPVSAIISDLPAPTSEAGKSLSESLSDLLCAVRKHLGMDAAFLSEFKFGQRIFRCISVEENDTSIVEGGSDPLDTTYCALIAEGKIPEFIRDAAQHPIVGALPITRTLNIRAYIGVPVRLSDGRIYGTFCCFAHAPNCSLSERDLGVMRLCANIAAEKVEQDLVVREERQQVENRIKAVIDDEALSIVYQPIYHLDQRTIAGFESLSRFRVWPHRTPDLWFEEAGSVDLAVSLEIEAIRRALAAISRLPEDVYLSINVSPGTILSGELEQVLTDMPMHRIVLEVTEHNLIDQYDEVACALAPMREKGLRVAVDDAGAGYASFRHILNLKPDIIKLDMSLTRNIDSDHPRRALASAFIHFSKATGCTIVAEGVETDPELHVLKRLGITTVQGYLLGRPTAIEHASSLCKGA